MEQPRRDVLKSQKSSSEQLVGSVSCGLLGELRHAVLLRMVRRGVDKVNVCRAQKSSPIWGVVMVRGTTSSIARCHGYLD